MDNVFHVQSIVIKSWRLYGVRGHCHVMPWRGSEEDFKTKFQYLLDEIDRYAAQGHYVSLAGASAGASAVLNAYIERPKQVSGVVLLCPKINRPEAVSPKTYADNPAFKESLALLQRNSAQLATPAKSEHIRTYYSPTDIVVPHADAVIPGVQEERLPAIKHGHAIVYGITLGAPSLIGFLKRQAKHIK